MRVMKFFIVKWPEGSLRKKWYLVSHWILRFNLWKFRFNFLRFFLRNFLQPWPYALVFLRFVKKYIDISICIYSYRINLRMSQMNCDLSNPNTLYMVKKYFLYTTGDTKATMQSDRIRNLSLNLRRIWNLRIKSLRAVKLQNSNSLVILLYYIRKYLWKALIVAK